MNIPSLPENLNRILFFLAIIVGAYSFLKIDENSNEESKLVDTYNYLNDSLAVSIFNLKTQSDELIWNSGALADKYNIPNPITTNDSIVVFKRTTSGDKTALLVSDSINKWYRAYKQTLAYHRLKIDLIEHRRKALSDSIDTARNWVNFFAVILGLSFGLLGFATARLMEHQNIEDVIKKRELNNSIPFYEECQSCGKHFSAIVQKARNKDNTLSTAFCQNCFKEGDFLYQTENAEEFINQSLGEELKSYSLKKRKRIIKKIKSLERWRSKY